MSGQNPPREIHMPLLSVWFRPQATMRYLMTHGTWAGALALFAVSFALSWVAFALAIDQKLHWFAIAVMGFVSGPIALLISAMFTKFSGKLLFGKASLRALATAITWASVPAIVEALLNISATAVMGQGFTRFRARIDEFLFNIGGAEGTFNVGPGEMPYAIICATALVLSLWGIWVTIRTVGAAQQFGWFRSLLNVGLAYGFALLIALGIRSFLWQPFNIPSNSMAPTLQVGDYIIGNKMSYGYGRYSLPFELVKEGRIWSGRPVRGDIVIFRTRSGLDYAKRVVGLPGDDIQMKNGVLHINGLPVKMIFVREDRLDERSNYSKTARVFKETLPNGVSYEIYDLRQNGDSDNTQAFHVPTGHYFVMGDNRDNSTDSRSPQIGNVSNDDLVAKVSAIYFSVREPKPDSIVNAFSNIAWGRMFRRP